MLLPFSAYMFKAVLLPLIWISVGLSSLAQASVPCDRILSSSGDPNRPYAEGPLRLPVKIRDRGGRPVDAFLAGRVEYFESWEELRLVLYDPHIIYEGRKYRFGFTAGVQRPARPTVLPINANVLGAYLNRTLGLHGAFVSGGFTSWGNSTKAFALPTFGPNPILFGPLQKIVSVLPHNKAVLDPDQPDEIEKLLRGHSTHDQDFEPMFDFFGFEISILGKPEFDLIWGVGDDSYTDSWIYGFEYLSFRVHPQQ